MRVRRRHSASPCRASGRRAAADPRATGRPCCPRSSVVCQHMPCSMAHRITSVSRRLRPVSAPSEAQLRPWSPERWPHRAARADARWAQPRRQLPLDSYHVIGEITAPRRAAHPPCIAEEPDAERHRVTSTTPSGACLVGVGTVNCVSAQRHVVAGYFVYALRSPSAQARVSAAARPRIGAAPSRFSDHGRRANTHTGKHARTIIDLWRVGERSRVRAGHREKYRDSDQPSHETRTSHHLYSPRHELSR